MARITGTALACQGESPPYRRYSYRKPLPAAETAAMNRPRLNSANRPRGEVAEWLNAPHSKCGMGASPSGVRIPPSPPSPAVFVDFSWAAACPGPLLGPLWTSVGSSMPATQRQVSERCIEYFTGRHDQICCPMELGGSRAQKARPSMEGYVHLAKLEFSCHEAPSVQSSTHT